MPSNLICPYCGQPHRDTAKFCPTTGKLLVPSGTTGPTGMTGPNVPPQAGLTGRLPANALLNNRWLVIKKIGRGGMAAVYQAADTWQPGRAWAVKEMSDSAITNPEEKDAAIKAFQQEALLLQKLNHPNLPKVVDVFSEGGKYYLVMEFVPGQTLDDMMVSRQQPFTEQEVLPWAVQLCEVLGYLHSQIPPIIFRDLKPGNIMITPAGQVRLIDFGIVRFFKPGKAKDTHALGTPGYNAPEAISGQTDERSDVYSLCVTLHQLLTAHDPTTTLFSFPPARQVNPSVSKAMEQILARGTEAHRDRRWPSVHEIKNQLIKTGGLYPTMGGAPANAAGYTPGSTVVAPISGGVPAYGPGVPAYGPGVPAYGPGVPAYGPGAQAVAPSGPAATQKTNRPTTRLLMAAAQLSGKQMAAIMGGITVIMVLVTGLLGPALNKLNFPWNSVPIIAMFGALGYSAFVKRGATFLTHVLLTGAISYTAWLTITDVRYPLETLTLAILITGVFMEIWVAFMPRIKGKGGKDAWGRELVWLMIMAVIGMVIFFMMLDQKTNPLQWLFSAVFAAAGWFLGDFIQQYLLYKRTGLRR